MSYQQAYDEEIRRSRILSGSSDADALHGESVDLSTRAKVERLIEEYERAEGHIEAAQTAVDSIEAEYSKLQTQRHALGWPTPASMPPDMNDRYNRAQAKLEVLREERDRLRQILDEWSEEEQEDRKAQILRQLGHMSFATSNDPAIGRRTACDGQRLALADQDGQIIDARFNPRSGESVAQIPDGAKCIIYDEASPYHKATLGQYRALCEWLKRERNEKRRQLEAQNNSLPVDEREPSDRIVARARAWKPSPWPPKLPEAETEQGGEATG